MWGNFLRRKLPPHPFKEFRTYKKKLLAVGVFYIIPNLQTSWISHHNVVLLHKIDIT